MHFFLWKFKNDNANNGNKRMIYVASAWNANSLNLFKCSLNQLEKQRQQPAKFGKLITLSPENIWCLNQNSLRLQKAKYCVCYCIYGVLYACVTVYMVEYMRVLLYIWWSICVCYCIYGGVYACVTVYIVEYMHVLLYIWWSICVCYCIYGGVVSTDLFLCK